jgi:hypothetical protein
MKVGGKGPKAGQYEPVRHYARLRSLLSTAVHYMGFASRCVAACWVGQHTLPNLWFTAQQLPLTSCSLNVQPCAAAFFSYVLRAKRIKL